MAKNEEFTGLQKAAILLITLGPERSADIFKHLKEDEIEELTLEIANTRSISPQVKEDVLNEFYQICLAQQYIAEGGIGYAKELLDKALGADKAQEVISKLTASLQVRPFEFVRKTDPSQLLNFIQDEHPQTIAMILSYLTAPQASMVLGALPPEKQADVAKRIAMMDRTSPDVIKEVERVLERKLSSLVNQDYTIVGGVDAIVSILNAVDRSTEKHIMESLEIEEPELADENLITGIAGRKDFSVITITKNGMSSQAGVLRQILEVLERYGINVDYLPSGIDTVSLVVSAQKVAPCLYPMLGDLQKELKPDSIHVTDNMAIVAAVGRKMAYKPGTSGRIFAKLGENGINIRMITQGPEELNIIVGVDGSDFERAIRVLYDSFVK